MVGACLFSIVLFATQAIYEAEKFSVSGFLTGLLLIPFIGFLTGALYGLFLLPVQIIPAYLHIRLFRYLHARFLAPQPVG